MGPCKEARVPFLVGPTKTGKSTLVDSVDDVFHWKQVFHLPADSDTKFALRNWLKNKRFLYFDEFAPVMYAHLKIISVTTFKKAFGGKYFEVQVPKNWTDGNVDFKWNRGCIFTNKSEGIWDPMGKVSAEDIAHMKSRVEMFTFSHQFVQTGAAAAGDGVPECRRCFAKWIVDACAEHDASQGLRGMPAAPVLEDGTVQDLGAFLDRARIPTRVRGEIAKEVFEFGAVHVNELGQEDWENLLAWGVLKVAERRRILALLPPTAT